MVLDVDPDKRRVSLGIKQTQRNPWEVFAEAHPVGSEVEGEVKNITEFGLFIGVDEEIDGMVHLSDLDWDRSGEDAIQDYKKGDTVRAKVLDVDVEKERVSLGVKQLGGDPMDEGGFKRGETVTCTVTEITTGGIEVTLGPDNLVKAFIRKSDISRDRAEQRPRAFCCRRQGRRARHQYRQGVSPRFGVHQGAGNGGRERSRRTVRVFGLRRVPG